MTVATVRRYQDAYNEIRTQAGVRAATVFASMRGLSQAEIDAYVARVVPVLAGAEAATARLVAGYLSTLSIEDTGTRFPYQVDLDQVTGEALRGVPPTVVYARPAVEARTAVKQGRSFEEAMSLGGLRAQVLAETDVTLAQRAAGTQSMSADPRITRFRRTLTGESCGLCAAAATQTYRTGQLHPIHTHCDCGVAPIYDSNDPGLAANEELLADIKEQVGPEYWKDKGWGVDEGGTIRTRRDVPVLGDDGSPLRTPSGKVRTRQELGEPLRPVVRTHGELGPVLTDPRHDFMGRTQALART